MTGPNAPTIIPPWFRRRSISWRRELHTLLEKMFHKSAKDFIASLYQGKKVSQKDIRKLSDYLKSLEKEE